MKNKVLLLLLVLMSASVYADNDTLNAAIGAGVGGAVGAAIGNELGGRDGATIGGAMGSAIGVQATTGHDASRRVQRELYRNSNNDPYYIAPQQPRYVDVYQRDGKRGYHCPPGQAKKGRC